MKSAREQGRKEKRNLKIIRPFDWDHWDPHLLRRHLHFLRPVPVGNINAIKYYIAMMMSVYKFDKLLSIVFEYTHERLLTSKQIIQQMQIHLKNFGKLIFHSKVLTTNK